MKFSPDTAGKRIRELREKKGITQKELAAARKMTQSAIAKQESGATAIGEEGLCWYADYFGVSAGSRRRPTPRPPWGDHPTNEVTT